MSKLNEIRYKFDDPLNELDSEEQTYGCRANNPDICANCYAPNICSFVREDKICKKPSRAWRKKYFELKEKNND